MKVCTAGEMRKVDAFSIEQLNIPGIVLMENAASSCTREIAGFDSFVIVVGKGNNGGDGLAIARQLINLGKKAEVYLVFADEFSGDAKINREILKNMNVEVKSCDDLDAFTVSVKTADCVVDAIFGTGIKGEVTGRAKNVIEIINEHSKYTLSVDVPSGINSDNGEVSSATVNADKTVTFAAYKKGMLLYPAADFTGEVVVANIQIPQMVFDELGIKINTTDEDFAAKLMPKRSKNSHKGDYGKILVIGGKTGMGGAVYLSSLAALKMGAGLVTVCIPNELSGYIKELPPEVMTSLSDFEKDADKIADMVNNYDAVLFGNGIGREENVINLLGKILDKIEVPIVIDADGLFALSKFPEKIRGKKAILTPHSMEMARLLDVGAEDVEKNRFEFSKDFAEKYGVTLVLKGNHSIITAPDGAQNVNMTGNSGMATAGSGDVLAGMTVALLAITEPFSAATLAVHIHGKAGNYAKDRLSETSVTAGDIMEAIPHILPVENTKNM